LAAKLGRSLLDTAFAILQIANELMIKAIGELTISEGLNPAESLVVAGGGAAGLSILAIARELGCSTVLVPRTASALSAYGMQVSDISTEHSATRLTNSRKFDVAGVNATLNRIDDELNRFVADLPSARPEQIRKSYFVEARYQSQVWELEAELPDRDVSEKSVALLTESFHQVHERVYAIRDEASDVEFVNWKGRVSVRLRPEIVNLETAPAPTLASTQRRRAAFFGTGGAIETPVYRASELRPGASLDGPAIIEEPTTTIVVYPGMTATVSAVGHFIIRIN
jgi:N-methylhydantoinase A